jgi:hypothetical protein
MRALEMLSGFKGRFGRDAARRTAALLASLQHARLRYPADLIRLHETALFLRAYPQSPRVLRLADEILESFGERLRGGGSQAFDDPEWSGVAGTSVSTNFSYEFARSLVARHGRSIGIDWEDYEHPDRLGSVLPDLVPVLMEDAAVEPHVDWKRWFESACGGPRWLLDSIEPRIYDLLEIPLRWDLGDSAASRSRLRVPVREIFYHHGPLLKRSDVSIEAEFSAPKIEVTRLARPRAGKILADIVDASAVRYRELWGFVHPDAAHVYHAGLGRGVDFYFFGVPDAWRLPLRAYHCGMFFKNGVPIGYFEGLSLFERMEAGFNLYYTFREGETAWLYARALKLFRQRLGVTCFSIDPYQVGHENEEAIESGAFWFYRKLGFRPASEPGSGEVARLMAREEARIAAEPGYRSAAATLRRLASVPMIYGDGHDWDRFEVRNIGYAVGRSGKQPWATEDLIRARHAPEESSYLRRLQKDKRLRAIMLRMGSGPAR